MTKLDRMMKFLYQVLPTYEYALTDAVDKYTVGTTSVYHKKGVNYSIYPFRKNYVEVHDELTVCKLCARDNNLKLREELC